jgi:hypothetical protein
VDSLHPNLSRIAAEYDEVIARFERREINSMQAKGQMLALIARDDNGTQWRLNPENGRWQYQTLGREWVYSVPPAYGYATPTAFDVTRSSTVTNPDHRISFHQVDESLLHPPTSLAGSTRRPANTGPHGLFGRYLATRSQRAIATVAGLVVIAAAWFTLTSGPDAAAPATPTPHASTSVAPGK